MSGNVSIKPISTNGLILYADSYNINSYISGSGSSTGRGDTWKNIIPINTAAVNELDGIMTGFNGVEGNPYIITFNGTSNYGRFGSTRLFLNNQTLFPTQSYTLEAWYYSPPSSLATPQGPIIFGGNSSAGSNSELFGMWYNGTDSKTYFEYYDTSLSTYVTKSSTITLNRDQWYNVSMVKDITSLNIYINGSLDSTHTVSNTTLPSIAASQNISIGGNPSTNKYYYGKINIIKYYNKSLSSMEVQQNYNSVKGRFGLQ